MLNPSVTPQQAVDLLNEAFANDPWAMELIVGQRVPCNAKLAEHPTIQVGGTTPENANLGILGIINGFFGIDEYGFGPICAKYDDSTEGKLLGFGLTADQRPAGNFS